MSINHRGIVFGDCKKEFMKTQGHCFINQGSWGSVPEQVYEHRLRFVW